MKRGDETTFREGMEMVPGQLAAQRRLTVHNGNVFPAFDSLDIMSVDAAKDYLDEPLHYLRDRLTGGIEVRENMDGKLFGVILGFAITCIEADRENRERT